MATVHNPSSQQNHPHPVSLTPSFLPSGILANPTFSSGTTAIPDDLKSGKSCGRQRLVEGTVEEGNNLMWLLDFKLDFFNDEQAKEKGKLLLFSIPILSRCKWPFFLYQSMQEEIVKIHDKIKGRFNFLHKIKEPRQTKINDQKLK